MEAKEVINFIQLYRHDLLNHLQVIHGYVKLGKLEKVEANMSKLFDDIMDERKLFKLNIPNVILWILKFREKYEQFQLSYTIDVEKVLLSAADMYIKEKLEQIMQDIQDCCNNNEMYSMHIGFYEKEKTCIIEVTFNMTDAETQKKESSILEDVYVVQTAINRKYSFNVHTS